MRVWMKVLLLNPHVDGEHGLVKGLQAQGHAVLMPTDALEAWQMLMLHGASIDLAIVHRESSGTQAGKGNGEPGLDFIARVKADASQADLPFILTSQEWDDPEFARHQDSPAGVNAYLKWPFQAADLLALIQAVFEGGEGGAAKPEVPEAVSGISLVGFPLAAPPGMPPAPGCTGTLSQELVLQDASSIFASNPFEKSDTSIRLEAPDLESVDDGPAPESELELGDLSLPTAGGATSVAVALANELAGRDGDPALEALEAPPELSMEDDSPAIEMEGGLGALEPAASMASVPEPEPADHQAAEQMPYLFQRSGGAQPVDPSSVFAQPVGDAVVPGGAAQSPDSETLKKYLLLREQDVAVLSSQLKAAKEQIKSLEDSLREERGRGSELAHVAAERERKLSEFDKERQHAVDALQGEINELRFQLKARVDKARILEGQVREAADEMERLKDRVRIDIRKIRVREKELENRLEIMKKDSEALISARENKIIELKRKLDLLEFNMDLLQDQHAREKESAGKLRERLAKAAQVVRVAGGLLDSPGGAAQLAAALGDAGDTSETG